MTAFQRSTDSPRPFAAAPDPTCYYPATAIEEARRRVGRSVLRGEGPVLVIGAAGLGKTMLLEVISQQFHEELHSVLLIGGQLCTRRALLQMILFQLGLPYQGLDEGELRLALLSFLQPQGAPTQRTLLLVDEADALPPRLLEELRALTNLSDAGQLLVSLVLAGNSTLEEQFADPKLELFSQRVSARCYLTAFGREETFQYVLAQVTAAGYDPEELFASDALEAIFAATDGVPRLVNQLCDQLMWTVSETGYIPLDGVIVQQAWSELQQLPAPWNTQEGEAVGGAVEFGELGAEDEFEAALLDEDPYSDDFDDDLPASIPISLPQPAVSEVVSVDLTGTETLDVTEQLLDQLSIIDTEPAEKATGLPSARNPFAETFESEEMVLDRYSSFENLLLAEAPKVENQCDTGFARQLQQYETPDEISVDPQPIEAPKTDTSEIPDPKSTDSKSIDTLGEEPTAVVLGHAASRSELGEMLVIEESEPPATTIVAGQKYRQLFSSLESCTDTSCFG